VRRSGSTAPTRPRPEPAWTSAWAPPGHHHPDRHPQTSDLECGVGAAPRALRRRRPITMIVRGLTHHRGSSTPDRLGSSPLDQPPARVTVQSAGRAHWRRIGGLPGGCQTGLGRLFPTWSPGQWPSCWPSWPAAPSIWPNSAPASRRPPSKPPTAESARRSPRPALDGAVVLGRATGRLMGGLLSFRSQGDGTVGL